MNLFPVGVPSVSVQNLGRGVAGEFGAVVGGVRDELRAYRAPQGEMEGEPGAEMHTRARPGELAPSREWSGGNRPRTAGDD